MRKAYLAPIPLIVFVLMCGLSHTHAVQPITGAFGKKLGDPFDPKRFVSKSSLPDGAFMYEFAPEKPSVLFNHYYVLITPTTNKIYAIWGIGAVEDSGKATNDQAQLVERLKNKYGDPKNEGIFAYPLPAEVHFDQGSRIIVVKMISRENGLSLDITYLDRELERAAGKESQELRKKAGDGL